MMESSQWLLKAYGGRVKELRLARSRGGVDPARSHFILSLINHRPGLTRLALHMDELLGVVAEAMRKGYCDKLQALEIVYNAGIESEPDPVQALCDALADGRCPKINALVVPGIDGLMPSMGKAMQSRMGKGCCGLKSLEIKTRTSSLSPLLSSGACEALEELKLEWLDAKAKEDFSEWLLRTRAPHLRAFAFSGMVPVVAQALCSPGVAPRLQVLNLTIDDAASIPFLSQAIGEGAWPHLRQLKIEKGTIEMEEMMPSLVEAIGVGARELTSLELGDRIVWPEELVTVARMLRDGGCPRLEELNLSCTFVMGDAVGELARALEGGAPCNTMLRRLKLGCCGITSVHMRELMESTGRGALPQLECLNLDGNRNIKDDGVVALAGVMAGGSLRFLQELGLRSVGMTQRGAKALFQALRDHKPCPHLKKIDISTNEIGDDGVVRLAKAIEAGALQHLQELILLRVNMGKKGFKSLVKAIVTQHPNPSCPRLGMLDVSCNYSIGDDGVMHLAKMMTRKGAMQNLREINLYCVFMGVEGASALFQSLQKSRVCPALETVIGVSERYLDLVGHLRDEMNARRGRACQIKIDWY